MCNFGIPVNYSRTDSSIQMFYNFFELFYYILQFTFEKIELDPSQFLICNFIRFKRATMNDLLLFYNSNDMISWALGGPSEVKRITREGEDITVNFLQSIHLEEDRVHKYIFSSPIIDRHYIWAGYDLQNIIHKYIYYEIFTQKFNILYQAMSKDRENLKKIEFGSECYNTNFFMLFSPVMFKGVLTEIKLIDITYDEYIGDKIDDFPNLCPSITP
jgi:hypothetical protein